MVTEIGFAGVKSRYPLAWPEQMESRARQGGRPARLFSHRFPIAPVQ
jgi:hypothetical protein